MRLRLRHLAAISALALLFAGAAGRAQTPSGRVLLVGTYNGIAGQYTSVQAAARDAQPGDWILVAPGDYKENGYDGMTEPAGVLITTPDVHVRGMDRNGVVIDGTKPGSQQCSSAPSDQVVSQDGRNGVVAFKVDGVWIENLTVCNYLTGPNGGEGNEIWWNGGDGSGKIAMHDYWGNFITATSSYSNGTDHPRGEYGIFVSNADGGGPVPTESTTGDMPSSIFHSYASNMGDAAYYVGACPDCNMTLAWATGEYSALGFSGTNAGGHLVIRDNTFDRNGTGAAPDSQNNDDAPSPNNGACPATDEISPLTGTHSCTVWLRNIFDSNNNPNVPGRGASGLAGAAPIGSGLVLAGTENHTVLQNTFTNNGSWGVLVTDLPDQENPPSDLGQNCQGGISVLPPGAPALGPVYSGGALCWFQAFGNDVRNNTFDGNAFYKNPGNADIGLFALPHNPGNCFTGNVDEGGLTAYPPALVLQSDAYSCSRPSAGDLVLTPVQANCATGGLVFPCPDTGLTHYPKTTGVVLQMPPPQETMADPCGVPRDVPDPTDRPPNNPWCPNN